MINIFHNVGDSSNGYKYGFISIIVLMLMFSIFELFGISADTVAAWIMFIIVPIVFIVLGIVMLIYNKD